MVLTAVIARPLRTLDGVEVALPEGRHRHSRRERLGQDEPARSALLRPHRSLLSHRGSARADPVRASRSRAPRRRFATTTAPSARFLASVSRTEGRRHLLDGSAVDADTAARNRPPVAVFSPDRLAWSRARRRSAAPTSTSSPRRAGPREPACAGATARRWRSATRFCTGCTPAPPPGPIWTSWDATLAEAAAPLIASRAEAVARAGGPLRRRGRGARASTRPRQSPMRPAPRAMPRSCGRAWRSAATRTSASAAARWGPHLDEVRISLDGRAAAPLRLAGPAAARAAGPPLRRAASRCCAPAARRR